MAVGMTGMPLAGRYRVLRRLGTGGMASVFLAEDQRLGRRVAVKRLHADSPADTARRFEREARFGALLNHPNIVSVYDIVADEEGVLIVMEYVDGWTLRDELAEGPLEPARALDVLRAVAAALDHAHAARVIHRDVKPANVLIARDDRVKLADLGIATAAEASRITDSGTVLGTAAYMPPERIEGQAGGPAADVYSLAAVAFEALSGQRAFTGKTPLELARRVVSQPAPDLTAVVPAMPETAAAALRRGLAKDPAERPASAGELVDELAHAGLAEALQQAESSGVRANAAAAAAAPIGGGQAADRGRADPDGGAADALAADRGRADPDGGAADALAADPGRTDPDVGAADALAADPGRADPDVGAADALAADPGRADPDVGAADALAAHPGRTDPDGGAADALAADRGRAYPDGGAADALAADPGRADPDVGAADALAADPGRADPDGGAADALAADPARANPHGGAADAQAAAPIGGAPAASAERAIPAAFAERHTAAARDEPAGAAAPPREREQAPTDDDPSEHAPAAARTDRVAGVRRRWLVPAALVGVACAVAALVAALASGGGHPKRSAAALPGATGAARSHASATRGQPAGRSSTTAASTQSATGSPAATVQSFYLLAARRQFAAAWALGTDRLHAQLLGYDAFARQEASLQSISFPALTLVSEGPSSAVVRFASVAVHTTRTDRCSGSVALVRGGAGWLIDRLEAIECTGASQAAAATSGAGAAAPQAPRTSPAVGAGRHGRGAHGAERGHGDGG